jgi:hypothetical protein
MVFVSYSREDACIVEPLVKLLRISSGSSVFHDIDSIPPGTKWRLEIASALEQCETVIVFWCWHAEHSKEVELEYQRAIELEKAVVPILLDSTGLPNVLAQYQAIDLRAIFGAHDTFIPPRRPDTGYDAGRYVLHIPSVGKLQRGSHYLVAQLYNLIVTRKHDA